MNVIAAGENRPFGRLIAQISQKPSLHELFAHFHDEAIPSERNKVIKLMNGVYAWSDDRGGAGKPIYPNAYLAIGGLNHQYAPLPYSGRQDDNRPFVPSICIHHIFGWLSHRLFGIFDDPTDVIQSRITLVFARVSLRKPSACGCFKHPCRQFDGYRSQGIRRGREDRSCNPARPGALKRAGHFHAESAQTPARVRPTAVFARSAIFAPDPLDRWVPNEHSYGCSFDPLFGC